MEPNHQDQAVANARKITKDFRREVQNQRKVEGLYSVAPDRICRYVTEVLAALDDHPRSTVEPLDLSSLYVDGALSLPAGVYPPVDMSNSIFGGTIARNVVFSGLLKLDGSRVIDHLQEGLVFEEVDFQGEVKASNANFGLGGFRTATFQRTARIENALIDNFSNCIFRMNVSLTSSRRLGCLSNCVFHDTVNLEQVQAGRFHRCEFRGAVTFHSGRFNDLHIAASRFYASASFNGAHFHGTTWFEAVVFDNTAYFNKGEFFGPAYFNRVTFRKPPEFYEAKLYPDTSFYTSAFFGFSSEAEWAAYRQLRHHAIEQMKSPAEEGRFFMYEQRTRANLDLKQRGNRFAGAISKMYDLTNNYGQNVFRPFLLLIATNVVFAVVYLFFCTDIASGPPAPQIVGAIGLSLQNVFAPFLFFGRQAQFVPTAGLTIALSIAQSIVTLTLITLWLLAIRRRLRKGSE